MSDNRKDAISKVKAIWDRESETARTDMINKINTDQYRDELDHKVKVYNDVKATLDLCRTMIVALDWSSVDESFNRRMLLENLDMARTQALLSAIGVEHEIRVLGK